ncbi:hypothetical protein LY76DRAFT_273011 [Colletotrichum caudatum]|nr:hypothetical protein LY76DRAFT_273011 [Colletotrichum caudatum]
MRIQPTHTPKIPSSLTDGHHLSRMRYCTGKEAVLVTASPHPGQLVRWVGVGRVSRWITVSVTWLGAAKLARADLSNHPVRGHWAGSEIRDQRCGQNRLVDCRVVCAAGRQDHAASTGQVGSGYVSLCCSVMKLKGGLKSAVAGLARASLLLLRSSTSQRGLISTWTGRGGSNTRTLRRPLSLSLCDPMAVTDGAILDRVRVKCPVPRVLPFQSKPISARTD